MIQRGKSSQLPQPLRAGLPKNLRDKSLPPNTITYTMPDSATVAKLRAAWPNVPIISFTSSLEALSVSCDQSSKPSEPKDEKTYRDSLSAQDTGKCRNCGKIAPLLCNGCKGLPAARGNSTIAARYCTKECQKQDWTVHKNDCKAAKTRQLLYRVADLTKGLFYIHSEITFSWAYLKKIDCYGPLRAVYTDEVKSERRNTLLVPFSTVTDLVSDRKEQEAYLSHLGCSGAVARFGPLLAARLRGMYSPYCPSLGIIDMPMVKLTLTQVIFN